MVTEVAAGVFCADHQVAEGKNGIVIGEQSAVVIDSGSDPTEAQVLADFVLAHGHVPQRLIFTHGHGDHVLGSSVFKEAEVIAHVQTPLVVRRLLPSLSEIRNTSVAQLETQIAWPTVTFEGELNIDLQGRHVHLFPTPGHSPDGIAIYVEEVQALFAGDTVVTGIVPAINEGDSRVLESSLQRLLAMKIEILVPGHGPVFRGRERIQDWLRWTIGYLSSVRAFARESLRRGEAPARIAHLAAYETFIGSRLPRHKHHMDDRHRDTVNKIVHEELDAETMSQ
jgi:cyclase